MRLGEMLVQEGCITTDQVQAALEKQHSEDPRKRLGEILMEWGDIEQDDLLRTLGKQYHVPVLYSVDEEVLEPALVERLPVEWARSHMMLPIRYEGRVAVLTADPAQVADIDDLALLVGEDVLPVLTAPEEIRRAIERCYYQREDTTEAFISNLEVEAGEQVVAGRQADDLLQSADGAPVARLVNLILLEALKSRASDVHIEPLDRELRVRFRMDGLLYEQTSPPKHLEAALVSRLKVMGGLDIAEKRLPQDGMARVRVGDREIDIRISTIPVAAGERLVLRLLNLDSAVLPLTALGMSEECLSQFRGIMEETHGAIWVTGPTGSGKTTTLYAALQELDTEHRNILTIEDPVEYQLPHIGQISVKPRIGLTFAQGLRHILRQDPDVILVGETRDLETAEIAIRSSLTGHLVFSTLHTNDAAGAMIRLTDMGIPPYLLAAATRAVLAQRLVRRLCPVCREQRDLKPKDQAWLGPHAQALSGRAWYPKGCEQCLDGYRDRLGIYELLLMNEALQEAVRQGAGPTDIQQCAQQQPGLSMFQDALQKTVDGTTSVAEVLRAMGRTHAV